MNHPQRITKIGDRILVCHDAGSFALAVHRWTEKIATVWPHVMVVTGFDGAGHVDADHDRSPEHALLDYEANPRIHSHRGLERCHTVIPKVTIVTLKMSIILEIRLLRP